MTSIDITLIVQFAAGLLVAFTAVYGTFVYAAKEILRLFWITALCWLITLLLFGSSGIVAIIGFSFAPILLLIAFAVSTILLAVYFFHLKSLLNSEEEMKKRCKQETIKACPDCAELVNKEARKCHHCGYEFVVKKHYL